MNAILRRSSMALAAAAVAGLTLAAAPVQADPPTRVARVNYIKGSVSYRPATLEEWGAATLNYPLGTGDDLWTDDDSWAELHVGSTAFRLAPRTAFGFLNLDDQMIQVRLSEGALDVRVRNLDGNNGVEIDTPSGALTLMQPGIYRVDVLPDGGSARVTVRRGMVRVSSDGPDFVVYEGQAASLYGTDGDAHDLVRAPAPDDWERWCRARDDREDRATSLRYVSYEMTGYEDLDDYGTWRSEPDYGWVWQPRVVTAGWAPYRDGRWRWVEPWGWTWVGDEPWGFAPFHYGRWACVRGSWMWAPGSYVVRPVYAPALVAFFGGDHWGLSFSLGGGVHNPVGWFPLAPGEFWMPHYRASHAYIRNLNVTNVNVTNINFTNYDVGRAGYVNRAINGAVTVVDRDTFVGGRAVARSAIAVAPGVAMRSQVVGTSAAVPPRAESLVSRRGGVAVPDAGASSRRVIARTTPPPEPVPFQARERVLQVNGGRPLDDATLERLGQGRRASARSNGAVAVRPGDAAPAPNVRPLPGAPASAAAPEARVVTPRPEANYRPSWARPSGATSASPAPRATPQAVRSADRPVERPASGAGIDSRPWGARAVPSESTRPSAAPESRPVPEARPAAPAARPRWGGESTRPPAAPEARPVQEARPAAPAARPRWGGESTRPPAAPEARPVQEARPAAAPEVRPVPEARPAAPAARPAPEARPRGDAPQAAAPQTQRQQPAPAAAAQRGGRGGREKPKGSGGDK